MVHTFEKVSPPKPLFRSKNIEKQDIINKPEHYHNGGIDVIKYGQLQFAAEENKGFYRMNALKYITRYDKKNGIEDLNKAKFYIDKLIELETK